MTKQPEEMENFFDRRAKSYDGHMKENVEGFDGFYESVSIPIEKTPERVHILDLGCGTGLELEWIFGKAPEAVVTGVDLSGEMLVELRRKYEPFSDRLILLKGSYLDLKFPIGEFDYVVSAMTMHHLTHGKKLGLYKKIRNSLKDSGKYIEGDYVVTPAMEKELLEEYEKILSGSGSNGETLRHIDIPFSARTQTELLLKAGFSNVEIVREQGETATFSARR